MALSSELLTGQSGEAATHKNRFCGLTLWMLSSIVRKLINNFHQLNTEQERKVRAADHRHEAA